MIVDYQVISRCRNGEQQAYKLCYEACAPYIYTVVRSYIYNKTLHKDVMQEVFAQIFKSIDSFDSNKGNFKSWIAQIAIHKCISELRKNNKLKMMFPLEQEIVDSKQEVLKVDQLSRGEIEKLLKRMPHGYKTVFLLSVIDGYDHGEIAGMLDISPQTSRSQLSRAISWAKKYLIEDSKVYIYG